MLPAGLEYSVNFTSAFACSVVRPYSAACSVRNARAVSPIGSEDSVVRNCVALSAPITSGALPARFIST